MTLEKEKIEVLLQEVKTAEKVLGQLYPKAASYGEPKSAGVVLRRFFIRERDLLSFLKFAE